VIIKPDVVRKGLNILVVDDEADVREIFRLALTRKGHDVALASSGEDAVEHANGSCYDLAFVDVRMAGMDGVETVKQLKALHPDMHIVVITAFIDGALAPQERQDRVAEAQAAGARGCLRKPFGIETIDRTVEYFARMS
jgi:two-component system, NtrC family, response regulator HydG